MKMQILRDAKGEIVATFERTQGAPVSVEAEVNMGFELEEMEVPDDCKCGPDALDLLYRKRPREIPPHESK